jgi:hypothetical protein
MTIELMFWKQIIHLQNKTTSCGFYSLKKSYDYMTKFPLVIQKMYN